MRREDELSEHELLERLLRTGESDGALAPEALPRFAQALRERAERIIGERLRPVEERSAALERECAWRKQAVEALEQEAQALKAELAALSEVQQSAAIAHERLLVHHRTLVGWVIEALEALPRGLPWSYQRVRTRLAGLVDALRREIT